jgi:hypothetical protein
MSHWLLALSAAAVLVAPTASGAADHGLAAAALRMLDDIPTPSEWSGIWNYQITYYLCDGEFPLYTIAMTDTICAGDSYDPGEGEDQNCTGTYTPTSIDIECSWSEEVADNCIASTSASVTGSVSAGSIQKTVILNVTYAGEGCGVEFEDMCTRIVFAGTRVAPQPAECFTPVEPASWGTIKTLYR